MLDEELIEQMKKEVPKDLDSIFISAVSGYNLDKLKDMLWQAITVQ
jgi:GTP-binding protein